MPTTDNNAPSDQVNFDWSNGSASGANYNKKRVTIKEKVSARDINELRTYIEQLYSHTHEYTDNSGGGTTTCG